MHYFSGIAAFLITVTLLYGMTEVFPKEAYAQAEKQYIKGV